MRLRVDDFPYTKPEESWKHNLDNFKQFDAVLEKHGIQEYTLGVIPKYVTSEQLDWLAENPRVEVALHGIEHDERFPNEFKEFETEDGIYNKLMSAKAPLKRCNGFGDVTTYIPPHNVVDMKTARALERAGFCEILCGPGTDIRVYDEINSNFEKLIATMSDSPFFYGRSDEMLERGAVKKINQAMHLCPENVLTLHWTWETNIGLQSLDSFLKQIYDR